MSKDWTRIKPLLEELVSLPEERHRGFLEERCDDPALVSRILGLVRADIESPVVVPSLFWWGLAALAASAGTLALVTPRKPPLRRRVWFADGTVISADHLTTADAEEVA